MKKILPFILAVTILAGCAADESSEVTPASGTGGTVLSAESTVTDTETTTKPTTTTKVSETTSETASVTTKAVTEEPPTNEKLGVNADGTLSEVFTNRISEFAEPYIKNSALGVYPSLYDFDYDGVPEVFLIFHSGAQGLMPCEVFSAEDFSSIGEFEGFCRDGFTRFSKGRNGGTIIHNYYEHSNWQREESVFFAKITDGKLETDMLYKRYGQSADGEYKAAMKITETVNEKAFGKLYKTDYSYDLKTLIGFVSFSDKDIMPDIQSRFAEEYAVTSYSNDVGYDSKSLAEAAVESYNNYIRLKQLSDYDDESTYCLAPMGNKNQTAFFVDGKNGIFFIDENEEITQISDNPNISYIKKLWDNMIVFQLFGNSSPCYICRVNDGKPEPVEEINGSVSFFGNGMYFDYSELYNSSFEMIHSVYDASPAGGHTFKKYQFYLNGDDMHEYGSIVVPWEEFSSAYGEAAQKYADEEAAEDYEIYEVLYRADGCFILNCCRQIYVDDPPRPMENCYNFRYVTLKPNSDGGFNELDRGSGFYLPALIPEIAVYPEKMYIPATEE